MARRDYAGNAVPTTMTAGITATDLAITLAIATGWPSGGAAGKFYITINRGQSDEERVLVASRVGTTLNIAAIGDRGVDDTSAADHGPNSTVEHTASAVDLDEANAHINDTTRDDHTQYLSNARHDVEARHQFGAALGTPSAAADIGTAAATGTGDDPAREDHVHKIGAGAINSSAMFGAGVVNAAAIGADAVGASELAPNAVGTSELADNAVDTAAIQDDAVTQAKMADDSVGTAQMQDDSVTSALILAAAVGTLEIAAGSVTMAKMASETAASYVPVFTGVSLGGGSSYGRYFKFGRLVVGVAGFTLGLTGNVTADIAVSLPHAAAAGTPDWIIAARATGTSGRASGMGVIEGSATVGYSFATIGADVWGATSPFNWDQNDIFRCVFVYESAA